MYTYLTDKEKSKIKIEKSICIKYITEIQNQCKQTQKTLTEKKMCISFKHLLLKQQTPKLDYIQFASKSLILDVMLHLLNTVSKT